MVNVKNVAIHGTINANNLILLKNAALASLGIINIPVWMVENDIKQGNLVPILEDFPMKQPSVPIHAVFAHNKHMAPKVRVFIDYLVEQLNVLSLLKN